jgi:predicted AAA+ superfamily ATPase
MISRIINNQILSDLKPRHVTGIFGARRTGKTFLLELIREELGKADVLMVQGDDLDVAEILSSQRASVLKDFVIGYKYLFIDEAQKIKNIGENLKLMVDTIPGLSILITGSSALELWQKTGEQLTGRSNFFKLFPFSQEELQEDYLQTKTSFNSKLIFGMYPQVYLSRSDSEKQDILRSIKNGYLLKDILENDNRKDAIFLHNLLRLIAFQIGNDISYNELASTLQVNKKTVQRYLYLLEKSYVLFSLPGFSRNLRKEYSKTPRFYFWDNGIRNILINNLNTINQRDDVGKLWENFCISEKLKNSTYKKELASFYFWRTYDQQEIDLIVEPGGKLFAYEFKWGNKKQKIPKAFAQAYPESKYIIINQHNFTDLFDN